jgi:hypothetical protein
MLFIIITLSLLWFIYMVKSAKLDDEVDTDLEDENLF